MLAQFTSTEASFLESDKSENNESTVTFEIDTDECYLDKSLHFTMTYENGGIKDNICASFNKSDITFMKGIIDGYLETVKHI
jgi:hypothetical protein